MKIWKAHYKDQNHDLDIELINTEGEYSTRPLSFTINGITFFGTGLGSFRLKDEEQYNKASREFSILKWGGKCLQYNMESNYHYELQRYSLEVKIPLNLVRKIDHQIVQGYLKVGVELKEHDMAENQCIVLCDNVRVYEDERNISVFMLEVEEEQFVTECKETFEENLLQLHRMIKDRYILQCCFTCQYADYSPYGSDVFGTMLCCKEHKSEYLKVNNKYDFLEYLDNFDCETRQETYLCEEFEYRVTCGGYRGYLE